MNIQTTREFNLFVLFIVSRDWQVKRDTEILKEIAKLHPRVIHLFLSEEEFTQGNASATLSQNNLNYSILPRKGKTRVPIWLSENLQLEKDFARIDFQILVELLGIQEGDRILVVSDGIGGKISGLPTEVLCEILAPQNPAILLVQHSFLPKNKLTLIRSIRSRSLGKPIRKLKVYNLSFDNYSKFQSIVSGAKNRLTWVVGNINLLSVSNQSGESCKRGLERISELVIFTNGSFRTLSNVETLLFESFVFQLMSSLPAGVGIALKPKGGEMENLKMRFANMTSSGALRIESENFSVEDISANQLVLCSIHSNVTVEASMLGHKFASFDLGTENQSRINQYLPEATDLCVFKEGLLDKIKLQSLLESQKSSPTIPDQKKIRLGYEIEEVRRKLRMCLTKILRNL